MGEISFRLCNLLADCRDAYYVILSCLFSNDIVPFLFYLCGEGFWVSTRFGVVLDLSIRAKCPHLHLFPNFGPPGICLQPVCSQLSFLNALELDSGSPLRAFACLLTLSHSSAALRTLKLEGCSLALLLMA